MPLAGAPEPTLDAPPSTRRSILPKPLRLSDLSHARQALVRLCQTINHGSIEDLEVRHSEPVFRSDARDAQ
jgi:hypothetical protein